MSINAANFCGMYNRAQKSPTLTSRLIQNMEFFKVVAPEEIVDEIRRCAKEIMASYE